METLQNNHPVTALAFLQLLEKHGIEPNFWCSEEYFEKAGFSITEDQFGYFKVMGEDLQIFPQIHPDFGMKSTVGVDEKIWSDFYGCGCFLGDPDFLDWEYIYDPQKIIDMKGSEYRIFRKNHKKIEKIYGCSSLLYSPVRESTHTLRTQLEQLFLEWLENRNGNEVIHDDDLMYDYLISGKNRTILRHYQKGILGVNIWDENFKYINYRFLICRPIPYLDEYMRWLFYFHALSSSNKLVNDGGVLDSPSLKWMKDRLNPVRIRPVLSWRSL